MSNLTNDQRSYLKKVYFDLKSPVAFSGFEKVWRYIKSDKSRIQKGLKLRKSQLKDWLLQQDEYTSYFPAIRKFKRPKTISPFVDYIWGSDVAYMLPFSESNDNFAYFVVFVDIFSRYAFAEPLKTLKARSMLSAMHDVFENRQPQVLFTDAGSEYVNRSTQKYLKDKSIRHYISRNEKKVAHAERFIKQIKRKLVQYMKYTNTHRWVDVLDDVVNAYNNSYHRVIKMTPAQASEKDKNFDVWNNQYFQEAVKHKLPSQKRRRQRNKKFKFSKGDRVKVSTLKRQFQREYNERFSTETFTITDRKTQQGFDFYKIKDEQNEPIIGWFYPSELLRVIVPEDKTYKIEKILRTRKRKGKKEFFVKFKGYPKKFNAWVSDIEES